MAHFMKLFTDLGKLKDMRPGDSEIQRQVQQLQNFITDNFYTCSKDILFKLGQMYAGGGEFTTNIDSVGGPGTAAFTAEAIRIYYGK